MRSSANMESGKVTTVVVGAGHAGLAISRCLADRSIEHVVLERGEVANSWRTERWDSLRLLTPNWQNALPGFHYTGNDPDGYLSMPDVSRFMDRYARHIDAPVVTHTTVSSIVREGSGYRVQTNLGSWLCKCVVLASGACNMPSVPAMAGALPTGLSSITPMDYKNPKQIDSGGVLIVGGSASGLQLAQELRRSGREVTLALGEHVRMPRTYRGRDIHWWMDQAGVLDQRIEHEADVARARRLPSPQLIGSPDRMTLDVNVLQQEGVVVAGRLAGIRDGKAQFSGSLRNCCTMADLKLGRLLDQFDTWAEKAGVVDAVDAVERFAPTNVGKCPQLSLDLRKGGIRTVIWATGYRPDYSWLHVPVLDRNGKLCHDRGIVGVTQPGAADTVSPGMYAMGLSYMRKRKSGFIYGAAEDALDITRHLVGYLDREARNARFRTAVPARGKPAGKGYATFGLAS